MTVSLGSFLEETIRCLSSPFSQSTGNTGNFINLVLNSDVFDGDVLTLTTHMTTL